MVAKTTLAPHFRRNRDDKISDNTEKPMPRSLVIQYRRARSLITQDAAFPRHDAAAGR